MEGRAQGINETRIAGGSLIILCAMLLLLLGLILLMAFVPPVSKDALTQHLGVPKLYLKHGRIHEIPFMVFSYYPMNLDYLYLVSLYFGSDIVPKYIHFAFALLTAWLIYCYLRRRINSVYALLGVVFFLSIPIIIKLSITVYVDLGLIFFSTASILFLFRWMEENFKRRYLILSALFCGLSMGTKYNGLIVFFLLTLFVPFIYSRYAKGKQPGFIKTSQQGLIFFFVALLVFCPWMIRNYVWTQNPVYPLYESVFNPSIQEKATKTGSALAFRSRVHNEAWWELALLPVRVFLQGKDGDPKYFDGKLNPFLLFLPFFAFIRLKFDPEIIKSEKKFLLAFSLLFFSFAMFSRVMRIRYIAPIIPPLTLLSIFGLKNLIVFFKNLLSPRVQKIESLFLAVGVALLLCPNAVYMFDEFKEVAPLDFISGSVGRDQYIERHRYEYPVVKYINEHIPADARILFIYMGNRGYYCDRAYVFDMVKNKSTLARLVKSTMDARAVFEGLRKSGITHLLIRYDIFDKWVLTHFTPEERNVLAAFFRDHVEVKYFKWGYGISQLHTDVMKPKDRESSRS